MTTRLTPYGSEQHAHNVAKVGKEKTPRSLASRIPSPDVLAKIGVDKLRVSPSLAARMPSADIVAKVGKNPISPSLVTRMPSPEVAAKVGGGGIRAARTHRVVRLNERG